MIEKLMVGEATPVVSGGYLASHSSVETDHWVTFQAVGAATRPVKQTRSVVEIVRKYLK